MYRLNQIDDPSEEKRMPRVIFDNTAHRRARMRAIVRYGLLILFAAMAAMSIILKPPVTVVPSKAVTAVTR